jgi:hypothetical protein
MWPRHGGGAARRSRGGAAVELSVASASANATVPVMSRPALARFEFILMLGLLEFWSLFFILQGLFPFVKYQASRTPGVIE